MIKLVWIAGGGAVGAVLRYSVGGLAQRLAGATFPVGTLAVNAVGCFVIGAASAAFAGSLHWPEARRLGFMVGVLGGFTTFSTYGWETFAYVNDGQKWAACMNVAANNVLGLGLAWLGFRLGEKWFGV